MDLEHIKKIYLKKVVDNLSAEENNTLQIYIKNHPESEASLRHYTKSLLAQINDGDAEDSLQAWKSTLPPKTSTIFTLRRLSVAALFVISIAAALLIKVNNRAVSYNQYTANGEHGFQQFVLEDGSKVWLQNGAVLHVDKAIRSADRRSVQLTGQAFFEVATDKDHPFIIDANQTRIQVIGTRFNVKTSDSINTVIVSEGKVSVQHIDQKEMVFLTARQSAKDMKGQLIKESVLEENYESWFTGKFTFDKKSIKEVIAKLNEYYDNQLILEINIDNQCALTASFEKLSLEEVIEVLQLSCQLKSEKQGSQYLLR